MEECRRNLMKVALKSGTIHHSVKGHHGAAKVELHPAPKGYRHHRWRPHARCFEVVGITDIVAKSHGSSNPTTWFAQLSTL